MFFSISAIERFSSLLCSSHFSLFQISILVPAPIIVTSLSNDATSRSFPGIKNLPCLSNSHSVAPDKKNLTKFLAFLFVIGSVFSLSSNYCHSDIENPNKQPSNPVVIMKFSPISSLSFAGIINLPLTSREWLYSPINTFIHLPSHFHHFVPLLTTSPKF